MEEAFRPGGFLDRPPPKAPHIGTKDASVPLKREDVDVIVRLSISKTNPRFSLWIQMHEFEIPRAQAEKVLSENAGDLKKALTSLIAPPSSHKPSS